MRRRRRATIRIWSIMPATRSIESTGEGIDTVRSSRQLHSRRQRREPGPDRASRINGTGNALANILTGNGGNNLIDGGIGADTMAGGDGDDTYMVDNVGDVITENDGEGIDTVQGIGHLRARRPMSKTWC